MRIGIIVATKEELEATKNIMQEIEQDVIYNLVFYTGKINKNSVVLVQCGIGKVNAARTTQLIIDKYNINKIINIGSAGGINSELNIRDIVIGNKLVQYDFDLSALGEVEKGVIQGSGKYFECDRELIEKCKQSIDKNRDFNYKVGIIATADTFCSDKEIARKTREEFGAECVEMEGAAVAQVCYLDRIPFIVIRGISDSPNGNNGINYNSYCKIAANQVAKLLKNVFEII